MSQFLQGIWTSVIEYETPRLVKIHNRKLGLARRLIQISIITYVLVYALFLQKGYQEFTRVESSVTVKIKGVTKSELGAGTNLDQSKQILMFFKTIFFSYENEYAFKKIEIQWRCLCHFQGLFNRPWSFRNCFLLVILFYLLLFRFEF